MPSRANKNSICIPSEVPFKLKALALILQHYHYCYHYPPLSTNVCIESIRRMGSVFKEARPVAMEERVCLQ